MKRILMFMFVSILLFTIVSASYTEDLNYNTCSAVAQGNERGMNVTIHETMYIESIGVAFCSDAVRINITDMNGNVLASASIVNKQANFGSFQLNKDTSYYILSYGAGGVFQAPYDAGKTLPKVNTNLTWVNAIESLAGDIDASISTTKFEGINNITFTPVGLGLNASILLISPANNTLISDFGTNFTINITATSGNLTNVTYFVYNSTHALVNQTSVSITGITNTTTLFIDDFTIQKYYWTASTTAINSTSIVTATTGNFTLQVGYNINGANYSNSTYEGYPTNLQLNITTFPSVLSITAIAEYNNTNYTSNVNCNGEICFIENVVIPPQVISNENVSFKWVITQFDGTTYYQFATPYYNQSVTNANNLYVATSCGGDKEAYKFTSYKETDSGALNVNWTYNIKYGFSNTSEKILNGTISNAPSASICIASGLPTYYIGYGEVAYETIGYEIRRFYLFEGDAVSGATRNQSIYSLNSTDSRAFLMTITDTSNTPLKSKYVSLLRWYPSLNEYKIIEMGKTDDKGQTILKVVVEDIDYRIAVYETNGDLIKLANPIRMICQVNPCVYNLNVDTTGGALVDIAGVQVNMTYDRGAGLVIYKWNDPSQNTDKMYLEVYSVGALTESLICSTNASGYTGILACNVASYSGNTIKALAYREASPIVTIVLRTWNSLSGFSQMDKTASVLLSVGFFVMGVLIGLYSPIALVLFGIVALIPALFFGGVNQLIFVGIIVLAGVIIHFIKRRSEL